MSTVKKTKGTVKKPAAAPTDTVVTQAVAGAQNQAGGEGSGVRRRDFIHIATVSFAGVGAAAGDLPGTLAKSCRLWPPKEAGADMLAIIVDG